MSLTLRKGYRHIADERELRNQVVSPYGRFTLVTIWSLVGQTEKNSVRANVFRSAPETGHRGIRSACPFCAMSGSHSILVATGRPPGRDVIRAARLAAILL